MSDTQLPTCEWLKRPDDRTGREVWQITSGPAASEAVYFEAQGLTADERYLVFRSERTGRSDVHRCDLHTGRIDPLTSGAGITGHSISMHPDGRRAFYITDCQKAHDSPLILIEMATGNHEVLCWPDASQEGGHAAVAHVHPSFSPRGNFIAYTSDKTHAPQVYVVPLS